MSTLDEVPDWAKVWMDVEVATWLHEQADLYFTGNVGLALNEFLRIMMAISTDPLSWAGIERHRKAISRGRAEALRQGQEANRRMTDAWRSESR